MQKSTVLWKDGTSEKRKIVYIPQTFLNRTIDDPEQSTAVSQIIEKVLLQEPNIAQAHDKMTETLKAVTKQVRSEISDYCEMTADLKKLENTIKDEGTPAVFGSAIDQLEKERIALASKVDLAAEEIDRYTKIESQLICLANKTKDYKKEIFSLEFMPEPTLVFPKYFSYSDDNTISDQFQRDFPQSYDSLQNAIAEINLEIQPKWKEVQNRLLSNLNKLLPEVSSEVEKLQIEHERLRVKIEQSDRLQQLSSKIAAEHEKLQAAIEREQKKTKLIENIQFSRKKIIQSQMKFLNAYEDYCNTVVQAGSRMNTALTFNAVPVWKHKNFQAEIGNIFDNRNFPSFRSQYGFDLMSLVPSDYGEKLLSNLWEAMSDPHAFGALAIKTAYNTEAALTQIFGNWYNIHYIVKSGEDTIEEMSPGKKALVLLELLISLENSKCPILIDQPEDDLDNRSIYEDLVQYIRERKHERQFIIVTHNANIVLGADAEEVIIANQNGTGTENAQKRFEYRSGAIENDEIETDDQGVPLPGILNKQGIQTQICNILEGGRVAFELRQNKYTKHSQQ